MDKFLIIFIIICSYIVYDALKILRKPKKKIIISEENSQTKVFPMNDSMKPIVGAENEFWIGDHVEFIPDPEDLPVYVDDAQKNSHIGTVISTIPSDGDSIAIVVRLNSEIVTKQSSGEFLIISPRFVGQSWFSYSPFNVELCKTEPENKPAKERIRGEWIAAYSTLKILKMKKSPAYNS